MDRFVKVPRHANKLSSDSIERAGASRSRPASRAGRGGGDEDLNMQAAIVPADAPLYARRNEHHQGYGASRVVRSRRRGSRSLRRRDRPQARRDHCAALRRSARCSRRRWAASVCIAGPAGLTPDIVVAPASGGGLIAGVATAVKARFPQAAIIVAEPEEYNDHGLSLRAGRGLYPHRPALRCADGRRCWRNILDQQPVAGARRYRIGRRNKGSPSPCPMRPETREVEPTAPSTRSPLLTARIYDLNRRDRAVRRQCRRGSVHFVVAKLKRAHVPVDGALPRNANCLRAVARGPFIRARSPAAINCSPYRQSLRGDARRSNPSTLVVLDLALQPRNDGAATKTARSSRSG